MNADAVLVPPGDHPLLLYVELLLVVHAIAARDHDVARGEVVVDRATPELVLHEVALLDVVGPVDDLPRRERVLDREDWRQGLDVDMDRLDRAPQPVRVRARHERDGLVAVLDPARREDRLVVFDQRHDVVGRKIFVGDHGDAGPVERRVAANPEESAPRDLTADGRAVKRAGDDEVVDVGGEPANLRRTVDARDALTDPARHGGEPKKRGGCPVKATTSSGVSRSTPTRGSFTSIRDLLSPSARSTSRSGGYGGLPR